jgi:hypothetical protein
MDLGGTTNWNKNPKALSWKSFHELHYNTYSQQVHLPYSKTDDAEFLGGPFTPLKLKLI